MIKISASIVIYNEKKEILKKAIDSFLSVELDKELIIVDNSPESDLKEFCESFNSVKYIFVGENIGFGAGHNLAFKNISQTSDIHVIVNPDTYFESSHMTQFFTWMHRADNVSLAIPNVCNPDGSRQNVVRNIPTPSTLFKRRVNPFGVFDHFIAKDEFTDVEFIDVTEIPFAVGCFMVFKIEVFKKLDGFDEQFFIYMEDIDIFIRAKQYGRTVINPSFKIYHEHRQGSSKKLKLLWWHIISALKFFWKYK